MERKTFLLDKRPFSLNLLVLGGGNHCWALLNLNLEQKRKKKVALKFETVSSFATNVEYLNCVFC